MHIVISLDFVAFLLAVIYLWGGILFVKRNCQNYTVLEKIGSLFLWIVLVFCSMNREDHRDFV